MLDKDLFVAENQRPPLVVAAAFQVAVLPDPATPKFLDLRTALDMARATPVYANFRVTTAFNNVANNILRFALVVDSVDTFVNVTTTPELVLVRSHDWTSAQLGTVGRTCSIVMPPFSDLTRVTADGRRFVALAVEAQVPAADWAAGGIDAWFSRHPIASPPLSHASGF